MSGTNLRYTISQSIQPLLSLSPPFLLTPTLAFTLSLLPIFLRFLSLPFGLNAKISKHGSSSPLPHISKLVLSNIWRPPPSRLTKATMPLRHQSVCIFLSRCSRPHSFSNFRARNLCAKMALVFSVLCVSAVAGAPDSLFVSIFKMLILSKVKLLSFDVRSLVALL